MSPEQVAPFFVTWFTTNFDAKLAQASSDSERWRISGERKRFLQVHSTIIARRNFASSTGRGERREWDDREVA